MAESVKKRIRRFTGQIPRAAVADEGPPILEHFMRIQSDLSSLVERHRATDAPDLGEFVQLVVESERAHIVTRSENYAAMRANGSCAVAGIELVDWSTIPPERQAQLWRTILRGKVANAARFLPAQMPEAEFTLGR